MSTKSSNLLLTSLSILKLQFISHKQRPSPSLHGQLRELVFLFSHRGSNFLTRNTRLFVERTVWALLFFCLMTSVLVQSLNKMHIKYVFHNKFRMIMPISRSIKKHFHEVSISSKYWASLLNQKRNLGWFLLKRSVIWDLVRVYYLLIISKNHSKTFFLLVGLQKNRSKVKYCSKGYLFWYHDFDKFRQVGHNKPLQLSKIFQSKQPMTKYIIYQ